MSAGIRAGLNAFRHDECDAFWGRAPCLGVPTMRPGLIGGRGAFIVPNLALWLVVGPV